MAMFRNASGQSLDLMVPEWYAAKTVAPGDTVVVDDDIAAKYAFAPSVWERVDAAPVEVPQPAPPVVEAPPAPPADVAAPVTDEGK